jgi:diguanylate cyclase (GGDEF)-like protein
LRDFHRQLIVSVWDKMIARPLHALRLDSVATKLVMFAVLATLIPTLAILAVYRQTQSSPTDTIAQQLRGASAETAREMDQWLNERLAELRTAAGSRVLTENLARIRPGGEGGDALGRLRDYLGSVRESLAGYEALAVIDARGRVVTSSTGRTSGMQLPADRLNALRTGDAFVGDPYWDAALGRAGIMLAVPIRQADGRLLGAFTAKLNLRSVADVLQRFSPGDPGDVYLMTEQGRLVIRSRLSSAELMRTKLPKATMQALFDKPGTPVVYKRADGQEVVGILQRVPQLRLAAVAEVPQTAADRQVGRPGNPAVVVLAVVIGIGLMAGGLGLLIVRPLRRLTRAAGQVAAGDLAVELPVSVSGELGYLTQVFNTMVSRLRERESQGELERLSVTDALTGLYNRRHLMGTLANEVQRSRRLRRTFSVLLADVDHFKSYNDTQGHLAGDAALVKIAEILRKMTRAVDSVARYGGEEFVVMLLETTIATAAIVAERIRARVAAEEFGGGKMTVSVGAAEYPTHGDTPEELIASADRAMYQAKGAGRDRVMLAGGGGARVKEDKEVRRRRKGEA